MLILRLLLLLLSANAMSYVCGVTPEWERELAAGFNSSRHLGTSTAFTRSTTLGPIRILPYYMDMSPLSSTIVTRIQQVIMPSVMSWFAHVLSVYNVQGNLIVSQTTCNSLTVPTVHQTTGVSGTDFIIYVYALYDSTGGYIARAGPCAFDGGSSRGNPIAGTFQYNSYGYTSSTATEVEIGVARHEMTHALGLVGSLFTSYRQPDGTLRTNPVITATMRGKTVTLLALPTAIAKAQAAFNCASLQGVEIEDGGGSGTTGSHPEKRIYMNDYMTGSMGTQPIYSDVTLGMMQDTGWYTVNFAYTDQIKYGRGEGCNFINTDCVISGVAQFPDFCDTANIGTCDLYNQEKATCNIETYPSALPTAFQYFSNALLGGTDNLADYCPYRQSYSNGDCKGRGSQKTDTYSYFGEQICDTCMCFAGTWILTGWSLTGNPNHSGCQKISCANGVVTVTIGTSTVQCPVAGGQVSSIPGYTGYITCPSYTQLCGLQVCPNGCFGYGTCNSGTCVCADGYSGIDCSIICDASCKNCSGTGSSQCTACYTNATLTSSNTCVCGSGYTASTSTNGCVACDLSCATCSGPSATDCSTCVDNASKSATGACLCDSGFTRSADATKCEACDSSCVTCSGLDNTMCKTCHTNASLPAGQTSGQCSCNFGYYTNADNTCSLCDVTCKTCTSSTPQSCSTCKPSTAKVTGGACVCPSGFFLSSDGSKCTACDPTCATCVGASSTECLSCLSQGILTPTSGPGTCGCADGQFYSALNGCQDCDPSCATCNGSLSTQCLSCAATSTYSATAHTCTAICDLSCVTCSGPSPTDCSTCVYNASKSATGACLCDSGFTRSADATQCVACDPSCVTCSGFDNTMCKTCHANASLPIGKTKGQCSCDPGYYTDADYTCSLCDVTCKTCSSNTPQSCSTCKPSTAKVTGGACVCPSGFFLSSDGSECTACDQMCATCVGASSTECLSCLTQGILTPSPGPGTCGCVDGQFYSAPKGCQNCDSSCATCNGSLSSQCLSCTTSSTYSATAHTCTAICDLSCATCSGPSATDCSTCVDNASKSATGVCLCDSGFARSADGTQCVACDSSCVTCSGLDNTMCKTCHTNASLPAGQTTGQCSCNFGYYTNADNTCSLCDVTCKTCSSNTPQSCSTCKPSTAKVTGGACVCPSGFFLSSDGSECTACDQMCATCVGASSTECLSCLTQGILTPSPGPGTCGCVDGQFYSASKGCQNCDSSCATCNGHSNTQCLSCTTSYTYSAADHTCTAICDLSCATCSGPSATDCSTCVDNASKSQTGACLCDSGFTRSADGTQCVACDSSCVTCSGFDNTMCKTCHANASLPIGKTKGQCSCDPGYYTDADYTCSLCDVTCKTCSSNTPQSCSTCKPSTAKVTGGACVCPSGFFLSSDGSECTACDQMCATCVGASSTECLSCLTQGILTPSPGPGTCGCADGQFYSAFNGCQDCDSSCATCNGSLSTQCLSCTTSYTYSATAHTCTAICDLSCVTCSAPSATDCSTCVDNASKSATGACLCDSGFTRSADATQCVACHTSCVTCSGLDNTMCKTCHTNASLPIGKTTGQCSCDPGYYTDADYTCSLCDVTCKTCNSNTPQSCSTCKPSTAKVTGGACVCPSGFFLSSDGSECTACDPTCATCVDASSDQCLSCLTQGILTPSSGPGTCGCADGQFYSASNGCQDCDPSCATCTVSLSDSSQTCTKCKNPLYDPSTKCSTCLIALFDPNASCATCTDILLDPANSCKTCLSTLLNPAASCKSCLEPLFDYSKSCTECITGYYLSSKTCSICGTGCASCASATACDICKDTENMTLSIGGGCACLTPGFYISGSTCVQTCPEGTFPSDNSCMSCATGCSQCTSSAICTTCTDTLFDPATNCTTCVDPNNDQATGCTQCASGYFLSGSSCVACGTDCNTCKNGTSCTTCKYSKMSWNAAMNSCTCDSGFYNDSTSCAECGSNCKKCSDGTSCAMCIYATNMSWSSSINTCQCETGYFDDGTGCTHCGTYCSECTSATLCTVCSDPTSMTPVADSDTCSCNSGFYDTGSGCTACGTYCSECTSSVCTSCVDPASQSTAGKICNCNTGFYDNESGCTPCGTLCQSCTSSNCLQCKDATTQEIVSGTTTCRVKCTSNQFRDSNGICTACDSSCVACATSSTNCQTCSRSYFPVTTLPGQCTQSCDASCANCNESPANCVVCANSYFPVGTLPGVCTKSCDPTCSICVSISTNCQTCASGFYPAQILPGTCVSKCDLSCSTCSSTSINCTLCSTGYQPYSTLPCKCVLLGQCHPSCKDNSSCTDGYSQCTKCAPGFTLSGAQCLLAVCNSSCATCNGGSYSSCLSCSSAATLVPTLGICLFKTCAGACGSCYGISSSQCLSCVANASKNPGTDYCNCNLYYTLNANTCVYSGPCHASCSTCNGIEAINCLSCPTSATLTGTTCVCNGNYSLSAVTKTCAYTGPCNSECLTCSGSGSLQCLSCRSNASLTNNSCICQQNYSWDGAHSQCVYVGVCDTSCSTCSGPNINNCLTCVDTTNGVFNSATSTCDCAVNFTWNLSSKLCSYSGPCAEAFITCNGPNAADGLRCATNAHVTSSNTCLCNSNYTWNPLLQLCTLSVCHPVCYTCTGSSSKSCSSCNSANHQVLSAGTCACDSGYFGIVTSTTDVCTQCDVTCQQCSGSGASECSACYSDGQLSASNSCECKSGYYPNPDASSCVPCYSSCLTCSNGTASGCITCAATFVLSGSTCICPPGKFFSSVSSNCRPCDSTCLACDGFLSTNCLTCSASQSLILNTGASDGQCICTADGQYNVGGNCSPCYEGCKTCIGPQSTMCMSCYPPAVLYTVIGPAACVCLNPNRPAPTPKVCSLCPSSCADCSTVDANFCTACQANAIPTTSSFPSACTCKAAYYLDSVSNSCLQCDPTCASCTSSSPFYCPVCAKYSNEAGLFCEGYCPTGFSQSSNNCVLSAGNLIFSISFSSMHTLTDAVSGYNVLYGSSTTQQATSLYQQGLQLSGNQYIQLPPNTLDTRTIVLSSTHHVELWIRPNAQSTSVQVLLNKSIADYTLLSLAIVNSMLKLTLQLYNTVVPGNTQVGMLYSSVQVNSASVTGTDAIPSGKTWSRVGYSVILQGTGTSRSSQLLLYLNGKQTGTTTQTASAFFRDFNSATALFLLGSNSISTSTSGFSGQIAELQLYNGLSSSPTPSLCPATCSGTCTLSGMCIIPCLSTQYFSASSCTACAATCSNGCLRPSDCRENLDPLCSAFTDFSGCSGCGNLAVLNSVGVCTCVINSTYAVSTSSCTCNSSFQQSGQTCVSCLNYFQTSDVSASFTSNYLSVVVSFAKPVVAGLSSCSDVFDSATVMKFGSNPTCLFDDKRQTLTIYFGTGATLVQEPLRILNTKVVTSQGACNLSIAVLAPVATFSGVPPSPVAKITAPAQYSTVCGSTSIGLSLSGSSSTGGVGRPLQYKWAFVSTPGVISLPDFGTYSPTQASITLSNSSLANANLSVTLGVKNAFGQENAVTMSIQVVTSAVLSVNIDGGTAATVQSNQKQSFKASVNSSCGSNTPVLTYNWILKTGSSSTALSSTKKELTIPSNSLTPGATYQFQCTVTDTANNISGAATLSLTVTSGPLLISCNRGDGDQPVSQNLVIDCSQSQDTDTQNPTGLKATWTCTQSSGNCKSANGGVLLASATSLVLTIPATTLVQGNTYQLTLTISKDTRTTSYSLKITIIGATTDGLTISMGKSIYVASQAIAVQPTVSAQTGSAFLWTQIAGLPLNPSTPASVSYLGIAANTAKDGETYVFTLKLTPPTASSPTITASITLQMNMPPTSGSFTTTPSTGPALTMLFTMSQSGWEDPEGTGYPLTGQFGYVENGVNNYMTIETLASTYQCPLFSGSITLVVSICDTLGSCTTSTSSVVVSSVVRRLQSGLSVEYFNALTIDSDQIPTVCIVFAKSGTLEQSLWSYILTKIDTYAQGLSNITTGQLSAELGCLRALGHIGGRQSSANLNSLISTTQKVQATFSGVFDQVIFNNFYKVFNDYPLTTYADAASVQSFYSTLVSAYQSSFLPDQGDVYVGGQTVGISFTRKMAFELSKYQSNPSTVNFTVAFPDTFTAEIGLSNSTVVDLRICQFTEATFPSGLIEFSLYQVGDYSNFMFQNSASQLIPVQNLITPINVTVPMFNYTLGQEYQCVYRTSTSWDSSGCTVIAVAAGKVYIQVLHLSTFAIVTKDFATFAPTGLPFFPPTIVSCEMWLAPVYTMISIVVVPLFILAVGTIITIIIKKKPKGNFNPATEVLDPPLPRPSESHRQHESGASSNLRISVPDEMGEHPPPDNLDINIPNDMLGDRPPMAELPRSLADPNSQFSSPGNEEKIKVSPPKNEAEHLNPVLVFLEGHYLIGLFIQKKWQWWEKLLCLMTVLLSQLFFLGVFYYYLEDSTTSGSGVAESTLWTQYSGTDALYYLYSFLLSFIISLLVTICFNVGEQLKDKRTAYKIWVGAGIVICVVAMIVFVILISLMDSVMCYEWAGKWCIGFLWCVITELLALEFVIAGIRFLALHLVKK